MINARVASYALVASSRHTPHSGLLRSGHVSGPSTPLARKRMRNTSTPSRRDALSRFPSSRVQPNTQRTNAPRHGLLSDPSIRAGWVDTKMRAAKAARAGRCDRRDDAAGRKVSPPLRDANRIEATAHRSPSRRGQRSYCLKQPRRNQALMHGHANVLGLL